MSITYTPTTNFGSKDVLPANDPNKVIVGAEFTSEFNAIQAAFALAAPTSNPTFSGTATYNNLNVTGTTTVGTFTSTGTSTLGAINAGTTTVGTFTSTGIDDNATSTAITIDSNENVGIGISNPATNNGKLVIGGVDSTNGNPQGSIAFTDGGNNGQARILSSRGTSFQKGSLDFQVAQGTVNSYVSALSIAETGNVGIGTDAPSALAKLDVVGGGIRVYNGTSATTGFLENRADTTDLRTVFGNGDLTFSTGASTAGTERMRIDAAGNVGIGTDSPTAALEVYQPLSSRAAVFNSSATPATYRQMLGFQHSGTDVLSLVTGPITTLAETQSGFILQSDAYIGLNVGGAERMRIDAAGNVGVGTTNPESLLTLQGDSPAITVNATDNNTPRIELARNDSVSNWRMVNDSAILKFEKGDDSTSWNEQYRVTNGGSHYWNTDEMALANGNFGVGTNNPTYAKTVIQANAVGESPILALDNFEAGVGNEAVLSMGRSSTANRRVKIRAVGTGNNFVNPALAFDVNEAERMRIDASGNISMTGNSWVKDNGVSRLTFDNDVGNTRIIATTTGFGSYEQLEMRAGDFDWRIGTSSKMKLDSSGNVLVGAGKTASNFTFQGVELHPTGAVIATTNTETCLIANRNGAGEVAAFYIDDVKKGFINQSTSGAPTFGAASDERLKDNIVEHDSELANVMALRPVVWDWKDGSGVGEGFIAQEVEQTGWSDLVGEDPDSGFKNLAGLGTVETRLIKAMQEQQAMIEALKAEVETLKNA